MSADRPTDQSPRLRLDASFLDRPKPKASGCPRGVAHLSNRVEEPGDERPQPFRIVGKVGRKLQGVGQAAGRDVGLWRGLFSTCGGREGGRTKLRDETGHSAVLKIKSMATSLQRQLQMDHQNAPELATPYITLAPGPGPHRYSTSAASAPGVPSCRNASCGCRYSLGTT